MGHRRGLGLQAAVRIVQLRSRRLRSISVSSLFLSEIFRIAPYRILFSAVFKGELHLGLRIVIRILGTKHSGLPAAAARFSEQRIADGIEDGGLACPGIAGDQIQAAGAQFFQIQHLFSRVGTESADL